MVTDDGRYIWELSIRDYERLFFGDWTRYEYVTEMKAFDISDWEYLRNYKWRKPSNAPMLGGQTPVLTGDEPMLGGDRREKRNP